MNEENDAKLCKEFPDIFRERHFSAQQSCMHWGFECGDGWYDAIHDLCVELTALQKKYGYKVIAHQVKEKFGGLRFYEAIDCGYYYCCNERLWVTEIRDFWLRTYSLWHKLRIGWLYGWVTDALYVFEKSHYRGIRLAGQVFWYPWWNHDRAVDQVRLAIRRAEARCYLTCEVCGRPSHTETVSGWVSTLCDECRRKEYKS